MHRTHRRTIVNASVTYPPAAHLLSEVPGGGGLRGRTRDKLAWYTPGIYPAVMNHIDCCDGGATPGAPTPLNGRAGLSSSV